VILPGLASVTFRSWSPQQVAAAAAQCNLAGIEWAGDVHVPPDNLQHAEEIGSLTRDHNLKVTSYGSYLRVDGTPACRDLLPRVLDTACALGAPMVRIWAGTIGSQQASVGQRSRIVESLRQACEDASRHGLKLGLEFHADTLNDSASSCDRLLQEVDHPALSTYWQPPLDLDSDQTLAELRQVVPRVSNMHVFHWESVSQRHPLATGIRQWRSYLQALEPIPHERYALLEFLPHESETDLERDSLTLHKLIDLAADSSTAGA
jgi:sugar phosphate isomerase/epimerase